MGEGLHAAHQAILQQGGPVGFQPYRRPLKFPLRVCRLNTSRGKKKAFEKSCCFFFSKKDLAHIIRNHVVGPILYGLQLSKL